MTSRPLPTEELSSLLEAFALEQSGLIVFAGHPSAGPTSSACALAEHISSTGRSVVAIGAGRAGGTGIRRRPVNRRGDIPDAIRAETAAGTAVLLVDSDQDVDSLAAIVKAAAGGALVIATMNNRGTGSYVHLLNLIEAAEDWSGTLRAQFDASLYAVITQTFTETPAGPALAAELHPGRKMQK